MGKETIFQPDYVVDLRIQLGKVIKLNEELTAENARLAIDNEQILSNSKHLLKIYTEANTELTSIKSKWWYKLMMCLNKN